MARQRAQPAGEDERPGEEREARGPLPEITGITIVILGALNPAILHPSWLARNGLLRPQEADQANIAVVAPQIAAFDIGWVAVQATHERLQLSSTSAPSYSMVKDLAVGVFSLLEHTPISAVGINHNQHFRAESDERWHRFGHLVAPVEPWEGLFDHVGVRSLIMEGTRPDSFPGYVRVQIEPSVQIESTGGHGVYIAVNDHYQLDRMEITRGAEAAGFLEAEWEPAVGRAREIVGHMASQL